MNLDWLNEEEKLIPYSFMHNGERRHELLHRVTAVNMDEIDRAKSPDESTGDPNMLRAAKIAVVALGAERIPGETLADKATFLRSKLSRDAVTGIAYESYRGSEATPTITEAVKATINPPASAP